MCCCLEVRGSYRFAEKLKDKCIERWMRVWKERRKNMLNGK